MEKASWDARLGDYSATDRVTGDLTLKQVSARVSRLPDSTVWLWSILAFRVGPDDRRVLVGRGNAECFDGAVNEWD